MPGVTLDTNIYVSALQFGGKPMALLEMALDGEIGVAISQPIISETMRVLRRKFQWTADDLERAQMLIAACTHRVTPTQTLEVITEDPSDDRILECAVEAGSDLIITRDNDLLRLGSYGNIEIIKVSEFLDRVVGGDLRDAFDLIPAYCELGLVQEL